MFFMSTFLYNQIPAMVNKATIGIWMSQKFSGVSVIILKLIFHVAKTGICRKQMAIALTVDVLKLANFCCIVTIFSLQSICPIKTTWFTYMPMAINVTSKWMPIEAIRKTEAYGLR